MYTEKTAAARAETQPACGEGTGQLPACGALAFPYVAMQGTAGAAEQSQQGIGIIAGEAKNISAAGHADT